MVRAVFLVFSSPSGTHVDLDWCVWAPPTGPTTIGESEGTEVAWCTKPGHGTRLIPAGAITGVQFLKSPSYLEVIAFLDQTKLNLTPDDFGGELDPHGADLVSTKIHPPFDEY